jgi:flagellar biosynthesis/type III secretory pathway M-ring protein FliF/YscJ
LYTNENLTLDLPLARVPFSPSGSFAATSRAVFIWSFVSIVVSLALATIIRDTRLSQKEEEATAQNQVSKTEGEEVRLEQGNRDAKGERVKQRS